MNNPLHVTIEQTPTVENIKQRVIEVDNEKKGPLLRHLLKEHKYKRVLVFMANKRATDNIAKKFRKYGIEAASFNADLEQEIRNDTLQAFKKAKVNVLFATDIAARGLDIKELSMVINYDLPHTEETYTHRIGRTGRAGAKGVAVTLYEAYELEKAEVYKAEEKRLFLDAESLADAKDFEMKPDFVTLVIEGGKKDKLRAGDILGALTGKAGVQGKSIGKIDIYERQAYVAIEREMIEKAYRHLKNTTIKNRKFSVWKL